jgi:hypothetical protein
VRMASQPKLLDLSYLPPPPLLSPQKTYGEGVCCACTGSTGTSNGTWKKKPLALACNMEGGSVNRGFHFQVGKHDAGAHGARKKSGGDASRTWEASHGFSVACGLVFEIAFFYARHSRL